MPRSKTYLSKLPKALREPIEQGLPPPHLSDDEAKAWVAQSAVRVASESFLKLCLLMDELDIPEAKGAGRWVFLSLALARKLYPGFLTTLEVRPKGRPRRGQRRADVGGVYVPAAGLSESPALALATVDVLRELGMPTDKAACETLLKCEDRTLRSPSRRTELARKTQSLASVIATMRQGAKRKSDGKLN